MDIFRICREEYADKLRSSGVANRWNIYGQYVVYAGSSRSLSTLEMVVHRASLKPAALYKLMVISIPDDIHLTGEIPLSELPPHWRKISAYPTLQQLASQWYMKQETLILKVPSVIIPEEYNYVINTKHPDFKQVKLIDVEDYFWDIRLL